MSWVVGHLDIVIVLVLLLVVVIVFVIAQTSLLPKRSLPFIAAALAGFFGLAIFRAWRRNALMLELKKREQELAVQEKRLGKMKKTLQIADEDLNKVQAEVNKQQAAYQKEILLIEAKKKEEVNRIDSLSDDEVFDEFAATFGKEGS